MSITWSQALAWRMRRHLLEPIGSEAVGDVVRRLGAVPATDEGAAELAVGVRRVRSRPGELGQALADGKVIKAFAFRGAMQSCPPRTAVPTSRSARPAGSGSCRAGRSTTSWRPPTGPDFARRFATRSRRHR